ncbi:phosphotransferase enzyme family protein [Deinococcus roseus]|uniref:Aminoglycoside phosphotransferase n=1 Tax=Deinococcus roseus TaxID=392414 RepID=A0ABQ2D137_9DEIO|nr:phosphotransferase [Deinococcus roseus]GGJ36365.1 aminoglycoside phosphotransferase [Deinococcus roseus]
MDVLTFEMLMKACQAFGVQVKDIQPLPGHRTRYRITDDHGKMHLLNAENSFLGDLMDYKCQLLVSVAYFLTYLKRKTDLPLPEPLLTREDELTFVGNFFCFSMLTWVEGEPIKALNQSQAFQAGSIMATLHHRQQGFERAEGFTRPWPTQDHLRHSWYRIQHNAHLQQEDIERIEALLARRTGFRYRSRDDLPESGLIHGDFKLQNYVLNRGKLRIVDFDHLQHNSFLYDIAVAFTSIHDPKLKHRFLEGYQSVAPLPGNLEDGLNRAYLEATIHRIGAHHRVLRCPEWIRKEAPLLVKLARRYEQGAFSALD